MGFLVAIGVIIFVIFIWIPSYKWEKRRERRKDDRKENKLIGHAKTDYDRVRKNKLIPCVVESIAQQKNTIENINVDDLRDWFEEAKKVCNKKIKPYETFIKHHENLNKREEIRSTDIYDMAGGYIQDAYHGSSLNEDYFDDTYDLETNQENGDDNRIERIKKTPILNNNAKLLIYLVKLKSTLDGRSYLVVGVTSFSSVEDVFEDDPIVELQEVINFAEFYKYIALRLEQYIIHLYRPDTDVSKAFDAYSKFDGYDRAIDMRSLKEASKKIEDFQKDEELLRHSIQDLSVLSFEQLKNKYGLSSESIWSDKIASDPFFVGNIDWRSAKGTSSLNYIRTLYKNYEPNKIIEHYKNLEKEFNDELFKIHNNFEAWKKTKINVMENSTNEIINRMDNLQLSITTSNVIKKINLLSKEAIKKDFFYYKYFPLSPDLKSTPGEYTVQSYPSSILRKSLIVSEQGTESLRTDSSIPDRYKKSLSIKELREKINDGF